MRLAPRPPLSSARPVAPRRSPAAAARESDAARRRRQGRPSRSRPPTPRARSRAPRRPAGTVEFTVTNTGTKVNEFYVYAEGDRIMGEVENITPGPDPQLQGRAHRAGHLPDRLQAGHGGRRHPRATSPSPGSAGAEARRRREAGRRRSTDYQAFVAHAGRRAARRTPGVRRRGQGRRRRQGQGALPDARCPWEAIEPVAGVLRRPRPEDRRPRGRRRRGHGVHRLPPPREGPVGGRPAARLAARSPTSCSPTSREIVAKAKTVELNPLQLANGSKALLDEIATGKITGEEERYSHTDLWDFDANFEGSQAGHRRAAPGPRGARPGAAEGHRRALRRALDEAARGPPGRRRASCSTPP